MSTKPDRNKTEDRKFVNLRLTYYEMVRLYGYSDPKDMAEFLKEATNYPVEYRFAEHYRYVDFAIGWPIANMERLKEIETELEDLLDKRHKEYHEARN